MELNAEFRASDLQCSREMAEGPWLPCGSGSDASFRTRPSGDDLPASCSQGPLTQLAGRQHCPFLPLQPSRVFVKETRDGMSPIFLYLLPFGFSFFSFLFSSLKKNDKMFQA